MVVQHLNGAQRERPVGPARGRDDPGTAAGGQSHEDTAGDTAGAVNQDGLAGPNGHGVQRLVRGERWHG